MKIGIEIHQRLNVGKLFCGCTSEYTDTQNTIKNKSNSFSRILHASKSEMGKIDKAAKFEIVKGKSYEYLHTKDNACLVDADEEPPHALNKNALELGLKIVKLLNAKPVDEIYYMRKIVVDGSNTSGFQRTAIIGMDGFIQTSKGKVRIGTIALEEESAGIVKDTTENRIYDLGRLGIPLVEITTEPDIVDGDHLKETAERIGLTLRGLDGVARGLGTIRQDINISEGDKGDDTRVEIKGVQELKLFPTIALEEIGRRNSLRDVYAKIKSKLNDIDLNVFSNSFSNIVDLTDMFKDSTSKMIESNLKRGLSVYGIRIPKFNGIFGTVIQNGRRYGTEISDYVKHCGVRGIIHSDEQLAKYEIGKKEESVIRSNLGAKSNDLFVLVIANKETAKCVFERMKERVLCLEIKEETRRVNKDGSTSYLRPMPGNARMYPETDVPPIPISIKHFESIKTESLNKRMAELEKLVGKGIANVLIKSRNISLFNKLVKAGCDPKLTATILENTIVSLRRDGLDVSKVQNYDVLHDVIFAYMNKKIVKSAIEQVLRDVCGGEAVSYVLKKYVPIEGEALKKIVIQNNKDMKKIMSKYRLKVFPEDVLGLIKN